MRNLIFLTGAAVAIVAFASPAAAQSRYDRNGNGVPDYRERAYADLNGNGILDYRETRAIDMNRNGIADWRERRIDANRNGVLDYRETRAIDMNRNGIADWRERRIDANRNGIDDRQEGYRYKMNWTRDDTCRSGVAKRNSKCVSPRKVAQENWKRGYRVPSGYDYTGYNDIPVRYRNQYDLNRNYNYVYRDNQIYVVNRNTSLVERIIDNLR